MATVAQASSDEKLIERVRSSPTLIYYVVSCALLGIWVAYYLFDPFGFDEPGRDTWHHVAVLRELMASPFAPSNPHIPTAEPSRYYTPIAVVSAIIGRLLHLSPYQLFGWMGAATCVGLVFACRAFALRYFRSPAAPLVLLLTLLFAWGSQIGHAGIHTYATLLSSAAYPASIVLVLGLVSWDLVIRALHSDRVTTGSALLLGSLAAVTMLEHQLSAVFILAGAGTLALFQGSASWRSRILLLAALAGGSLASIAWPYFSVVEVMASASDPRWKSAAEQMNHFSTTLMLAGPTFIGVLGFRTSKGKWRWELILPFVVFTLGYVALLLRDSPIAHRIPPAIVLYNQLGFVWLIVGYLNQPERKIRTGFLAAIGAVVIATLAFSAGFSRMSDLDTRRNGNLISLAQSVAAAMPPGSVSFATESFVFPFQSTGMRVVSIPRPEPAAPSLNERQVATDRFFDPATSQDQRRALAAKWGATQIVLVHRDLKPEVMPALRALGTSKKFPLGVELISIDRGTPTLTAKAQETAHAG